MREEAGSTLRWSRLRRPTLRRSKLRSLTRRCGGDGGGHGFQSALGVARGLIGDLLLFRLFFLGDLLLVVLVHDASHVGLGFVKRRHSSIPLDALGAGGADVILIPEIPFDIEEVAELIRQ